MSLRSHKILNEYLFFIVWPFGSVIKSLRLLNPRFVKISLWMFTVFLGATIIVISPKMDLFRYMNEFALIAKQNLSFTQIFSSVYDDGNSLDAYKPFMIYLCSRFTTNPQIFISIVALVYGYFYARNFQYILLNLEQKLSLFQRLFLYCFLFIIPIQAFQFIKFQTAAQVFFFGLMPYLLHKEKKYLIFSFLSPLVHFSFALPVIVLIIHIFSYKNIHFLFYFFILTSFFVQFDLTTINEFLKPYTPRLLEYKISVYGDEGYSKLVKEEASTLNWYIKYYGKSMSYTIIALSIHIYALRKRYIYPYKGLFTVFCFALLIMSAANLINAFPSAQRFLSVGRVFGAAAIILILNKQIELKSLRVLQLFLYPLLLLFFVVSIRILFDTTGILTYIGNPFLLIFFEPEEVLIEFIKSLIQQR